MEVNGGSCKEVAETCLPRSLETEPRRYVRWSVGKAQVERGILQKGKETWKCLDGIWGVNGQQKP